MFLWFWETPAVNCAESSGYKIAVTFWTSIVKSCSVKLLVVPLQSLFVPLQSLFHLTFSKDRMVPMNQAFPWIRHSPRITLNQTLLLYQWDFPWMEQCGVTHFYCVCVFIWNFLFSLKEFSLLKSTFWFTHIMARPSLVILKLIFKFHFSEQMSNVGLVY